MKSFVFFLLVCVALAAAAPQLLTTGWPGAYGGLYGTGLLAPYGLGPRTLVAGPTVLNGLGGRLITPGYIGAY